MTTAAIRTRPAPVARRGGAAVLAGAAVAVLAGGLLAAVVAALTSGAPAALGVAVGVGVVLAAFGLGAFVVDLVAGVLPAASLMVALLTYVLQVVVLWVVFSALDSSSLLDGTLDRTWLGVTVIVGCLVWITAQLLLAVTARIPAYDLPEGGQG